MGGWVAGFSGVGGVGACRRVLAVRYFPLEVPTPKNILCAPNPVFRKNLFLSTGSQGVAVLGGFGDPNPVLRKDSFQGTGSGVKYDNPLCIFAWALSEVRAL